MTSSSSTTATQTTTHIAFVGCGFVADYYLETLKKHPELKLAGVMDQNIERASQFGAYYRLHVYPSLEALFSR
jgi:predicted dehydrogenase